jgi:hypothetical protein
MPPPRELTEAETLTLREMADRHPHADFRRRALGVLALAKSRRFALVADILGVTAQAACNWAEAWRTQGLSGLPGGHEGGAPAKLAADALDEAERIARAAPRTLAEIDRLLREARPDPPAFSRDRLSAGLRGAGCRSSGRACRSKKAPPGALRGGPGEPDALPGGGPEGRPGLFHLDESGCANVPNVQRAWSPRGEPHAADASAARKRANAVGALEWPSGALRHDLGTGKAKRDAVASPPSTASPGAKAASR